jgi:hypothetical protein
MNRFVLLREREREGGGETRSRFLSFSLVREQAKFRAGGEPAIQKFPKNTARFAGKLLRAGGGGKRSGEGEMQCSSRGMQSAQMLRVFFAGEQPPRLRHAEKMSGKAGG